jgi:signal transduction histidine kinase
VGAVYSAGASAPRPRGDGPGPAEAELQTGRRTHERGLDAEHGLERIAADPRSQGANAPADRAGDPRRAFDVVLFVRHAAIFASALVAYYQHSRYGMGWTAFAVVTTSAAANFAFSFVRRRPGLEKLAEFASPVVGVGCWTALASATGGLASPFVAGLWLEIILASGLLAPIGIVSVTLGSVAGLWILTGLGAAAGSQPPLLVLVLHTAFLLGMGALAYGVAGRVLRTETDLLRERNSLDVRLQALSGQLEQEREVGRLGENVAKLAHGLTNAVHSLRGFAALIEPTVGERQGAQAALAGLRVAIDDLEGLARLTLDQPQAPSASGHSSDATRVLERALEELRRAHPSFHWSLDASGVADAQPVAILERDLLELCLAVMRNAVEAARGKGSGEVCLRAAAGRIAIEVRDHGPGIPSAECERIFEPGYTTKPSGSGYGLYLARRVVADAGGELSLRSRAGEGTTITISLPSPAAREAH